MQTYRKYSHVYLHSTRIRAPKATTVTKMAQMTSRYTASHRDVVKSRNQASAFVNNNKCNINRKNMLAASHEGEHFLSWATEDFTQGRTAKLHTCNFKGNRRFQKTRFNTKQHMRHRGISPGSMLWKLQPTSYQEKYHHKKEVGKTSHWCVPCSAGPQHEDPPLKGSAVPSSDSREHSSHRFQHLLPSLQGLRRLFLGVSVHMTIS